MLRSPEQGELTSEVLDEVLQLHFALGLDVGAVHVRVEQDDGKGQDEDGVWVPELAHEGWVTHTVPLAAGQEASGPGSRTSNLHLPTNLPVWHHQPFPLRSTPKPFGSVIFLRFL